MLIIKPTERGITNKIGQEHMSILLQDSMGNWYDFTRSVYVEGDFSEPLGMIACYEDMLDKKYRKYADKVEYNSTFVGRKLDDLARALTEDFADNYSPLYNNCAHVIINWFSMGKISDSDKT